ncbi:YetF domain-containing protein [Tepidibacter aestuarii]|uniref:YetF domain-containing protein n=1 Tax=Tepidibacter aestuarii TaxID=2925782 RepID=UPI0020BD5EE0|nr:DUF421 domain-containing protein [Tepidibacter aestuarii]CAH2214817.1 conserved membrane protein of unknown function [Tepidibacter aestuarii]
MFNPLTIVLRVFLALIFLFIATKLLTKRSLANLTYFDYVATTVLGTIAGNLAFNIKINISIFILSMTLITLIIMLISYVSLKYSPLRKFVAGEPTILIRNGKILEYNLSKLSYSYNYLNQQLRQEGVFDINKVEFAILEPSGELSIKLKSQNSPLTPQDLNLSTEYEGLATEIILDGKILENNLQKNNFSKKWLYQELNKKGIKNINEISFAALSSNGNLYVDLYRD